MRNALAHAGKSGRRVVTSPDKSGITVGTRSYTTHWDTIVHRHRRNRYSPEMNVNRP
jgi:hypothetical protein